MAGNVESCTFCVSKTTLSDLSSLRKSHRSVLWKWPSEVGMRGRLTNPDGIYRWHFRQYWASGTVTAHSDRDCPGVLQRVRVSKPPEGMVWATVQKWASASSRAASTVACRGDGLIAVVLWRHDSHTSLVTVPTCLQQPDVWWKGMPTDAYFKMEVTQI